MDSESTKKRDERIDPEYYKRPDPVAGRRWWWIGIVGVVVGAWLAIAPAWGGRDRSVRVLDHLALANHGPLAKAHAMWDADCAACHVSFGKVNGSRWAPNLVAANSDAKCQSCHAGPTHHSSQIASEIASCAECHRDHRGRDANISAVDDATCTACHADLSKHRQGGSELAFASEVTRFEAGSHPEFKAIGRDDPGKLKFDHEQHLAAGMPPQGGGPVFTFAMLDEKDRARYGYRAGQPLTAPVKLECASCHVLDGSNDPGGTGLGRTAGAYFEPIAYDRHCAACHTLRFEPANSALQVRHGRQPAEVVAEVKQLYEADAVHADPALLQKKLPPRPKPGQPASEPPALGAAIQQKVDGSLRKLEATCAECHSLTHDAGAPTFANAKVEPPGVPEIWFEHARFDHTAHRAMKCDECHGKAATSSKNTDVLLPAQATCLQCHGPSATSVGTSTPGTAGNSCVECHRYHGGDEPRHGQGARARAVAADAAAGIDRFLGRGPRP